MTTKPLLPSVGDVFVALDDAMDSSLIDAEKLHAWIIERMREVYLQGVSDGQQDPNDEYTERGWEFLLKEAGIKEGKE